VLFNPKCNRQKAESNKVKKVLVAVDGFDHSQRAIELAADIAAKYDAKLLFLNVIDKRPLNDAEHRLAETEFSGEMRRRMAYSDWTNIDPGGRKGIEPIFARHIEI
jgi:nucleotide-binding universal stress UspA family protein